MKTICVLFNQAPPDTHYKPKTYSWVEEPEALSYIKDGYGVEYDPLKASTKKPKLPKPELPEDLPGREHFNEAGKSWNEIQDLHKQGKLASVEGIGSSTEHKINTYLGGK